MKKHYTVNEHVEWVENGEAIIRNIFVSESGQHVYSIWPVYEENQHQRYLVFEDELKDL